MWGIIQPAGERDKWYVKCAAHAEYLRPWQTHGALSYQSLMGLSGNLYSDRTLGVSKLTWIDIPSHPGINHVSITSSVSPLKWTGGLRMMRIGLLHFGSGLDGRLRLWHRWGTNRVKRVKSLKQREQICASAIHFGSVLTQVKALYSFVPYRQRRTTVSGRGHLLTLTAAALRYSLTPQTPEDQTTSTRWYRWPSNFRGEGKALRRKHYASTGREPESG